MDMPPSSAPLAGPALLKATYFVPRRTNEVTYLGMRVSWSKDGEAMHAGSCMSGDRLLGKSGGRVCSGAKHSAKSPRSRGDGLRPWRRAHRGGATRIRGCSNLGTTQPGSDGSIDPNRADLLGDREMHPGGSPEQLGTSSPVPVPRIHRRQRGDPG